MISTKTKIKRVPQRGCYEKEKIYNIVDEAMVCQVAFQIDKDVHAIPTIHWREDDYLYIHGSTKSRLIQATLENTVCISITIIDGLVLARSAFHHSMNYRSVVIYSKGQLVENEEEKMKASKKLVEKILPQRWDHTRPPSAQELKATAIVKFTLNEMSAKIRIGDPVDDTKDLTIDTWAGQIPMSTQFSKPITAKDCNQKVPDYITQWLGKK